MEIRDIKNFIFKKEKLLDICIYIINLPVIGHIYDYFYIKRIKNKIKNQKLSLTIEPNNICNLHCIMCPYQRMTRKKETMPLSLYKEIVNQAKEEGCESISLNQYNEPLTDKFLFERIRYANSKGMITSFYSNGTLLSDENINRLLKNPPDLIRFSFDGFNKNTYESIRCGANYERVIGGIIKLYEEKKKLNLKKPRIEVYFTILKENKSEIKEFLKFWKNKVDFATIYIGDSRQNTAFSLLEYKHKKFYPCFNPKKIIVFSNGKLALCCVDIDGFVNLGDLKKQKLKDILESKKFKDITNAHLNRDPYLSACKSCSRGYIDSALSWWV